MTKGQQVEVVSTECQGAPEFCLVRLVISAAVPSKEASSPSDPSAQEGLVPTSILKPFPPQRKEEAASNGKLYLLTKFLGIAKEQIRGRGAREEFKRVERSLRESERI